MVGAYHVPIQLVLQNKDDEDIGLLFQGVYVCMCFDFVCTFKLFNKYYHLKCCA